MAQERSKQASEQARSSLDAAKSQRELIAERNDPNSELSVAADAQVAALEGLTGTIEQLKSVVAEIAHRAGDCDG